MIRTDYRPLAAEWDEAVAKAEEGELGIETVFARVLPEDKAWVRKLQGRSKKVAMLGDRRGERCPRVCHR